jgi:hypothetical protein
METSAKHVVPACAGTTANIEFRRGFHNWLEKRMDVALLLSFIVAY